MSTQNVQTGSAVYPFSTGRAVPEIKQTGREADHSAPRAKDKNSGVILTFTHTHL